jgi:hypothetical protein
VSKRWSGWSEEAKSAAERIQQILRQRTWDDYVLPSPTRLRKMAPAQLEEALVAAVCRPKSPKERKREAQVAEERAAIEALAKKLKEAGDPRAKSTAEQIWADMQGVTVAALRKRRYRKK